MMLAQEIQCLGGKGTSKGILFRYHRSERALYTTYRLEKRVKPEIKFLCGMKELITESLEFCLEHAIVLEVTL